MINELYNLAEAMKRADVEAKSWHREYKPIPNIKANAPCIRILIADGKVLKLSSIDKKIGSNLRKYGNNQGSYPCMNLAPLYRISDDENDEIRKKLISLRPEEINAEKIAEIRTWCKKNNWESNFKNKYKISMVNMTSKLESLIPDFKPIRILIGESNHFRDSSVLHRELENEVFKMLSRGENISLALSILFYKGKSDKNENDDYGRISIALETPELIDNGIPAISNQFTSDLNSALLSATTSVHKDLDLTDYDAFGIPFKPLMKEPMPDVKLAGGIDVKLRTMFKDNQCQERYHRIENDTYPISPQMRKKLQSALEWLGSAEHKDIFWINTDKNEVLFAYPATPTEVGISYTRMFKRPEKRDGSFEEQAKNFISEIRLGKEAGTDSHAEQIEIFVLRKISKGCTKIVYTRQTDPYELEKQCEAWTEGCLNLPDFAFGQPSVLFPLDISDVLNCFWNQDVLKYFWDKDGKSIPNKFRPTPNYHGIELLMDSKYPVSADLHCLAEKEMAIGAFLGNKLAYGDIYNPAWDKIKDMLALTGLILYRDCIGKDVYMKSLPYLYGQLLKVSDELHALYCNVVRDNQIPAQLVGGSVYQAAVEAPVRTLSLLGQRMNPYIIWAKSYRTKNVSEKGKESWKAGWLISLYENIAEELFNAWDTQTRFNDEEKALLFLGYLANFSKKEQTTSSTVNLNN